MSQLTKNMEKLTPHEQGWLSSGNNKKGRGVHVGIIDSGILFTDPDLADNYIGGANSIKWIARRITLN